MPRGRPVSPSAGMPADMSTMIASSIRSQSAFGAGNQSVLRSSATASPPVVGAAQEDTVAPPRKKTLAFSDEAGSRPLQQQQPSPPGRHTPPLQGHVPVIPMATQGGGGGELDGLAVSAGQRSDLSVSADRWTPRRAAIATPRAAQGNEKYAHPAASDDDGGNSAVPASEGGGSTGIDESLESNATTAAGSRASGTGGTSTGLVLCGQKIKIPFTVWTFLAMAVPVTMLLITALIPTAEAADDLVRVAKFRPLAHDVSDCVTAVAAEDHAVHHLVYHPSPVHERAYRAAQVEVDRICDAVLLTDLRDIAVDDAVFDKKRDEMQSAIRLMRDQRTTFDLRLTTDDANRTVLAGLLATMRPALDGVICRATNAIARVATVIKSETSRLFVDLKLVGDARAKLWLAASTGSALLSVQHPTTAETYAFVGAEMASETVLEVVEGAASPAVASMLIGWRNRNATKAMFAVLHSVLEENSPDAAAAHDEVRFAALMEGPLAELRDIEASIVHMIDESAASKASVARNVSLLAAGVLLSAVAALLLARQQLRVQDILTKQVERVETTKKAVSAFVPRFFLNKMGYTSITHVCVGDSAEVALTMLFADIRQFTTVAEDMTSRELFNWVQGYFRLMTTIIEGHHGNINQFIGDALFALFSTAKDGVACAVDMQAKTQQLNLERLCLERNRVPLNIGVGLHHDVLSLGILGDDKRHTCTAISASVNLASRLEGLTKQLGCRILASEAVVDQLGPTVQAATALRRVGPAQVKGSGEPVPVYDVFQADDRALQEYKFETAAKFAEYTGLALPGREPSEEERKRAGELRKELQAAAGRHDTVDLVLAAIDTFGAKGDGRLRFDAK